MLYGFPPAAKNTHPRHNSSLRGTGFTFPLANALPNIASSAPRTGRLRTRDVVLPEAAATHCTTLGCTRTTKTRARVQIVEALSTCAQRNGRDTRRECADCASDTVSQNVGELVKEALACLDKTHARFRRDRYRIFRLRQDADAGSSRLV